MGSINALPNYTAYFNLPENGNASTGIVFAIFQVRGENLNLMPLRTVLIVLQVGQMSGALFIWMTDWYGRTWHIFFGCLGVCIGTVVTSLSTSLPMFIAGRFLLSFFATCAHTAAPLYLVELAPAAYRGTIAGMYNTFYNVVRIDLKPGNISLKHHSRALCSLHQRCTHATNTSPIEVTLTGDSLFGFRWFAQDWSAFLSNSTLSLPDGRSITLEP